VLEVYQNLFTEMTNPLLIRILIQSIIKNRANHYSFFLNLTEICVKDIGEKQTLGFFFDIFSEFQSEMS